MSDQPVAEISIYTGQQNVETKETNIHALIGIRAHDPSDQVTADLRHKPRGHRDRRLKTNLNNTNTLYDKAIKIVNNRKIQPVPEVDPVTICAQAQHDSLFAIMYFLQVYLSSFLNITLATPDKYNFN
jgi:hypothetical protein